MFSMPFYFPLREREKKKKKKEKKRRRIGGCGLLATNNTEVMLVFVCRDFHFV